MYYKLDKMNNKLRAMNYKLDDMNNELKAMNNELDDTKYITMRNER